MARSTREYRKERFAPRPTVADPRRILLDAVFAFVGAASQLDGVIRITLIGSLATEKKIPKDADLVVLVDSAADLAALARAGRSLQGKAQRINLGADIFLADIDGTYLGRTCAYRDCHARADCRGTRCFPGSHLRTDFHVLRLPHDVIANPPVELWPNVIRYEAVPDDVEELLLSRLGAAHAP